MIRSTLAPIACNCWAGCVRYWLNRQWRVINIDSTILAQRPRLAGHIPAMQGNIAHTLGVKEVSVGIKSTTTEGLDAIGAVKGIGAHAVALLLHDPSLQDCACMTPR